MSTGTLLIIGFLFVFWCLTYLLYRHTRNELFKARRRRCYYANRNATLQYKNGILKVRLDLKRKELADLEKAWQKLPKKKRDFIKHELKRNT